MKPTSGGAPKRLRARQVLLAAQVALSMLLVVTAVLLGRSLANANAIDPGFTIEGVDVADFDLRLGGVRAHSTPSLLRGSARPRAAACLEWNRRRWRESCR